VRCIPLALFGGGGGSKCKKCTGSLSRSLRLSAAAAVELEPISKADTLERDCVKWTRESWTQSDLRAAQSKGMWESVIDFLIFAAAWHFYPLFWPARQQQNVKLLRGGFFSLCLDAGAFVFWRDSACSMFLSRLRIIVPLFAKSSCIVVLCLKWNFRYLKFPVDWNVFVWNKKRPIF